MLDPKIGDKVIICDGSDADGDSGVIWFIQENGICLVELDHSDGTIWPVMTYEIERMSVATQCGDTPNIWGYDGDG